MYRRLQNEPADKVTGLIELSQSVRFKDSRGSRCRMGLNGSKACSIYNYSKWFDWKAAQRAFYKTCFPKHAMDQVLQGWFLELPPKTGFLDVMNYWVGADCAGTIVCTALRDQSIIIGDETVGMHVGERLSFNLRTIHEIKPSDHGQLWACIMIFMMPDDIVE